MSNKIDIIKIDSGNYGIINFNNMIPVTSNNYELFDLNSKPKSISEAKKLSLLKSQQRWLNTHRYLVKKKADTLYKLYTKNKLPKNVVQRCCNFKLLEQKCNDYNKQVV